VQVIITVREFYVVEKSWLELTTVGFTSKQAENFVVLYALAKACLRGGGYPASSLLECPASL